MTITEQMKWLSENSVDMPNIDNQHKELMSFFNEAINNSSGNINTEKNYYDKVIDVFINFVTRHFKTEEELLTGKGYAQYDEHKLDHTKLLEKIHLVKNEIEGNRWEMNLFILSVTLKDWFLRHFNSYDINAKEYFREEKTSEAKILAFQN